MVKACIYNVDPFPRRECGVTQFARLKNAVDLTLVYRMHRLHRTETLVGSPAIILRRDQGFDSIVARGVQEPDPSKDTTLAIDGKQVTVPQGKPKSVAICRKSCFSKSEYSMRMLHVETKHIKSAFVDFVRAAFWFLPM